MLCQIICCLALASAGASQNAQLQPRPLQPSSGNDFLPLQFQYYGEAQCDQSGQLYFTVDKGDYDLAEVLRISADGQQGTWFKLSGKFADTTNAAMVNYSVTPAGNVYMLAVSSSEQAYLFTFDSDGRVQEPVSLELPEHLILSQMVAFDDASIFLFGYYYEKAPPHLRGKPYAAILDASGKVEKTIDVDLAGFGNKTGEAQAARSPDGNVYVLGPGEITVLSASGRILRRIPFAKPDPAAVATNIRVSTGFAAIGLTSWDQGGRLTRKQYLVLDLMSGGPFALYQTPTGLDDDVCFSRQEGFTFLAWENGRARLVKAALR